MTKVKELEAELEKARKQQDKLDITCSFTYGELSRLSSALVFNMAMHSYIGQGDHPDTPLSKKIQIYMDEAEDDSINK